MRKKMLAGIVAGALMVGSGFGLLGGQAQAADTVAKGGNQAPPHMMRGHKGGQPPMMNMNPDTVAKKLHETFGVSEAEVKEAINNKQNFQDIGQAAMLSKISGKSLKDVLEMKTADKHWPQVSKELGVKPEQIHQQMNEITADRMAKKGDIDKAKALALLNNGYRAQDISMAVKLAKLSGKDVQAVLDMKKINNRWDDVAKQLGVDMSKLRPDFAKGAPHGGPQGGPPAGDEEPLDGED